MSVSADTLRTLMSSDRILVVPGVYNGISAKVAKSAGFQVVYASGGAIARSMAVPDIGLITLSEMVDRLREIVDATDLPVIADADTGYGNPINVTRTVREYERCGVAAFHLEDQVTPKKCGHYEGKELVPVEEMEAKLRAVLWARRENTVVIARTDARAVAGLDEAIHRAKRYKAVGADVLFVEAPRSVEEIQRIAEELEPPLLINMFKGGKTPWVPPTELQRMGYSIMIIPSDIQRAAVYGMQKAAEEMFQQGSTEGIEDRLVTFSERDRLVELSKFERLERQFLEPDIDDKRGVS